MDLLVANDPDLPEAQHESALFHIGRCLRCAREYEETEWLTGLLRRHWPHEATNETFLRRLIDPVQSRQVIHAGWRNLRIRIPELAHLEKRRHTRRLVRSAGTLAACLALVFLTLLGMWNRRTPHDAPPTLVASAETLPVRIEQSSEGRSLPVFPGTLVKTGTDGSKTLTINDRHPIVMSGNTGLEALAKWKACLQKLQKSPTRWEPRLLQYSVHAGRYVVFTRTAIWLWFKNSSLGDWSDERKAAVLWTLGGEINAAQQCARVASYLLWTAPPVCSAEGRDALEQPARSIDRIADCEEYLLTNGCYGHE
jgi:hypothetical protein